MATRKPISTISYNTEPFLREKLDAWVDGHIIQSYMYICHKGEEGDKDHIHLRIEPNKSLDPMDLSDALKQYPMGADKPLGVRPWRPSKEEDWILYAVHDADYLANKSELREKIPYSWKDIRCNDGFDIEVAYMRARATLPASAPAIIKQLGSGVTAADIIMQGGNAFLVNQCVRALAPTDYERVQGQLTACNHLVEQLVGLLHDCGVAVSLHGYDIAGVERVNRAAEDGFMPVPPDSEDDIPF